MRAPVLAEFDGHGLSVSVAVERVEAADGRLAMFGERKVMAAFERLPHHALLTGSGKRSGPQPRQRLASLEPCASVPLRRVQQGEAS